jgi:enoyl-CoA hydratase
MKLENIKLDVKDFVAVVGMNRAPVNAMSASFRRELIPCIDSLHDRNDVRVIVLTSALKVFCAGADIKERASLTGEPGEYTELNRLARETFYSLIDGPKPVIAAVNGAAMGAGMALTLCCDIIVASDNATFAMPEVDRGLAGGVKYLQRHFTPSKARMLLMSGQVLSAQEMHRLNVIEKVVPLPELMPAAMEIANTIAAKSPLAVQMIKQSFSMVEYLPLKEGYRLEQNMTVKLSESEDAMEAKRAFLEKRKPVYKGR